MAVIGGNNYGLVTSTISGGTVTINSDRGQSSIVVGEGGGRDHNSTNGQRRDQMEFYGVAYVSLSMLLRGGRREKRVTYLLMPELDLEAVALLLKQQERLLEARFAEPFRESDTIESVLQRVRGDLVVHVVERTRQRTAT
jgi:hypothetical protein